MFKNALLKGKFYFFISCTIAVLFFAFANFIIAAQKTEQSWETFLSESLEKEALFSEVNRTFGYGGGIHAFKNFVLRGDLEYGDHARESFETVILKLNAYFHLLHVTQKERTAITTIKNVVLQYQRVLEDAFYYRDQNYSIQEIDNSVRIDDAPALEALEMLKKEINALREREKKEVEEAVRGLFIAALFSSSLAFVALVFLFYLMTHRIGKILYKITSFTQELAAGNLYASFDSNEYREVRVLAESVQSVQQNLQRLTKEIEQKEVISRNKVAFLQLLQEEKDLSSFASTLTSDLAQRVGAPYVGFYSRVTKGKEVLFASKASFCGEHCSSVSKNFALGEGLVGICGKEGKAYFYEGIFEHDVEVGSGLGDLKPKHLYLFPVLSDGKAISVIELATFIPLKEEYQKMLEQSLDYLGVIIAKVQKKDCVENGSE